MKLRSSRGGRADSGRGCGRDCRQQEDKAQRESSAEWVAPLLLLLPCIHQGWALFLYFIYKVWLSLVKYREHAHPCYPLCVLC
jgi:hypothetical protein